MSVFENYLYFYDYKIIFSQFYQISLVVKLLINCSSLSLHDALHIMPFITHSNLRVFDTIFTFQ